MTALDFPALDGRPVTQAHADVCAARGHATHTVDGVAQSVCPRCGEARITARPVRTVVDVFAGRPELRTSYSNQRSLAARDLGGDTLCVHGATLAQGCTVCRASGSVLVPAASVTR